MDQSTSQPSHRNWNIDHVPCPLVHTTVTKWHLDSPKTGQALAGDALLLRGWVVAADPGCQGQLHVVLRHPGHTESRPLNQNRSDVLAYLHGTADPHHSQLRSGFEFPIPLETAAEGFEIGFETDGSIRIVAKISAAPTPE